MVDAIGGLSARPLRRMPCVTAPLISARDRLALSHRRWPSAADGQGTEKATPRWGWPLLTHRFLNKLILTHKTQTLTDIWSHIESENFPRHPLTTFRKVVVTNF
jgi:hypothetical protein